MQVINNNWLQHFLGELKHTEKLCLVSPFITNTMVSHLLDNWKGDELKIITRFNLNDFRNRASSLSALERLVNAGIVIKGITGLHSKAYLFDERSAIITSANFTTGGFFNNYELGILTNDTNKIQDIKQYIEFLWSVSNGQLSMEQISEWKQLLAKSKSEKPIEDLPDYGASPVKKVIGEKSYFVKFYGTREHRADLDETVKNQVEGTHCHFAVTFPHGKGRPRKYREGDIVFMACMLHANDYAIFGKAICRRHIDERDVASVEDIEEIGFKEKYPIYIRVHSGEFLDTTFKECPKLKTLMFELGAECFEKSKERYLSGDLGYEPQYSLRQQADVELSEEGAFWMETEFEKIKTQYSLLPQSFIEGLYQGTPQV
jgi:HKD family nuclease